MMNNTRDANGLSSSTFTFREDEDFFSSIGLLNAEFHYLCKDLPCNNQVDKAIDLLKLDGNYEKNQNKFDFQMTAEYTMKQDSSFFKDSLFGDVDSPKRAIHFQNLTSQNFEDSSKFLNNKSQLNQFDNEQIYKNGNEICKNSSKEASPRSFETDNKSTRIQTLAVQKKDASLFLGGQILSREFSFGETSFDPVSKVEQKNIRFGTRLSKFQQSQSNFIVNSPSSKPKLEISQKENQEEKSNSSEAGPKYVRTKLASIVENEKEVSLSLRRDVVNKTILRVLRRYFTQIFKGIFPKKFKTKESKKTWYLEYIKSMCTTIFGRENEHIAEIQFYMASMVQPDNMKESNFAEFSLDKEQFDVFHSCLYKYSHTKMVNLLKIKPIGLIYQYFYNGPLDQILMSEASVRKNSDVYLVALKEFNDIFTGAADVSTLILN